MDYQTIYNEAREKGLEAGKKAMPVPMVVKSGNYEYPPVMDGVCGFAWVNIDGRSGFAKWLKKKGIVRNRSYYGGFDIWIGEFNQSMTRKEAMASAMAEVFKSYRIKAYSMSRMD